MGKTRAERKNERRQPAGNLAAQVGDLRRRVAELEEALQLRGELGECAVCGAAFVRTARGRQKRFCSKRCRQNAYRARQRG